MATQKFRDEFLKALVIEIRSRDCELSGQQVETIYFGGGTPSLLKSAEIQLILDEITHRFHLSAMPEITLEANPDDLDREKLNSYKNLSVNRLSIGIQSFYDEDLTWLNRSHNAQKGVEALDKALDAGFTNISIDLIYGIPGLTEARWKDSLDRFLELRIPHLSAYDLTVETKTALDHMIRHGRRESPSDEDSVNHFRILQKVLARSGYRQYEISNFSLEGRHSRHNTAYWQGIPYLGLGPSAHSYTGDLRSWNPGNLTTYIRSFVQNQPARETEILTTSQKYNEYVMTSLRTMWGCDTGKILKDFGKEYLESFRREVQPYLKSGDVKEDCGVYTLTEKGMLFADRIAAAMFVV